MTITKKLVLTLLAGGAAAAFSSPAVADGPLAGLAKPLADSGAVAAQVVPEPEDVQQVVGVVGKAARTGELRGS
ncbi:hypothetical protein [Streptomyces sp. cmx-4-9]|uniref:hypothetical protein n=1 Tax=Streptomyces sp. cmx-4-9 TaxID=2790941 RepID=UPI00398017ED